MKFSKRFFFFLSIFLFFNIIAPVMINAQTFNTNSYKGLKDHSDYADGILKSYVDGTDEILTGVINKKINTIYGDTDIEGSSGTAITFSGGTNITVTRTGDSFEISAAGDAAGITKIYGDTGDGTGVGAVTIKGDANISVSQLGNTLEINFLGTIPEEKMLMTNFVQPDSYEQGAAAEGHYRTIHFTNTSNFPDIFVYRNGLLQNYIYDYSSGYDGDTYSVTFNYDISSTEVIIGTMFGLFAPSVGP